MISQRIHRPGADRFGIGGVIGLEIKNKNVHSTSDDSVYGNFYIGDVDFQWLPDMASRGIVWRSLSVGNSHFHDSD